MENEVIGVIVEREAERGVNHHLVTVAINIWLICQSQILMKP